jgi:DNA-binding transcriptional ArsR family regulator
MTDTPTLTDRILAAIAEHSGITATELRFAIPDASPRALAARVSALLDAGRIESAGLGRHRLPDKRQATTTAAAVTPPAFVVPLVRLMAGR